MFVSWISLQPFNKVAVTIDTDKAPNKGVIIEGTAKIEELTNETKRKIDRRMAAKHVKTEYLDEYIEWDNAQGVEYIYIRIRPEKSSHGTARRSLLRTSFTVLEGARVLSEELFLSLVVHRLYPS